MAKNVRTSATSRSGVSNAAKCPPECGATALPLAATTVFSTYHAFTYFYPSDGAGPGAAAVAVELFYTGLAGITERIRALGGAVEAGPVPDDRFRLAVRIPERSR